MRVLVTRPKLEAAATAIKLKAMGHQVTLSPVLEIISHPSALPTSPFNAMLITSANALAGVIKGTPPNMIYVVGSKTAEAVIAAGWPAPELVSATALDLQSQIIERHKSPAKFLYLAGHDRKSDLEATLRAGGHTIKIIETYSAKAAPALTLAAIKSLSSACTVLHYSRRSAGIFVALVEAAGFTDLATEARHLCLSADVAVPLAKWQGVNLAVAERPDEEAMLEWLASNTDNTSQKRSS